MHNHPFCSENVWTIAIVMHVAGAMLKHALLLRPRDMKITVTKNFISVWPNSMDRSYRDSACLKLNMLLMVTI